MQEQNLSKTYRGRKVFLCAFYSGNLYPTAMRFHREFRELQKALQDKFDIYVYIYNQYNLPDDDRFDKSRLDGTRGYGYWSWKPFIISKTLEKINEGDILLYIDIGCELRSDGTQRFIEYLDYTIEHGMVCGEMKGLFEAQWTKGDLFAYFNLNPNDFVNLSQRAATLLFMINNERSREIINRWLGVFYEDFSLVDDSNSKIPNHSSFIENRHDQSVFSLLSRIYDIKILDFGFEFHNESNKYPILVARNKVSVLKRMFKDNLRIYIFFGLLRATMPLKDLQKEFKKIFDDNVYEYLISFIQQKEYKAKKSKHSIINTYISIIMPLSKHAIRKYEKECREFLGI